MRPALPIFTAAAALAGVVAAQAAVKPETAIHYRQSVYTMIGWNFSPLAQMVKGKVPFDTAEFSRHAERIAFLAPRSEGSDRHLAMRRLAAGAALVAAVLAILNPERLNDLAHSVGVTRGADLMFYCFITVSLVVWIRVWRRIAVLEGEITKLVRALALATAQRPGDSEHQSSE